MCDIKNILFEWRQPPWHDDAFCRRRAAARCRSFGAQRAPGAQRRASARPDTAGTGVRRADLALLHGVAGPDSWRPRSAAGGRSSGIAAPRERIEGDRAIKKKKTALSLAYDRHHSTVQETSKQPVWRETGYRPEVTYPSAYPAQRRGVLFPPALASDRGKARR